jgi:hypothetical protein
MASGQALIAKLDRLIELFNARGMDLPDGLFDRKTQFVLNGAPFETLLGQPPTDPLVLMLTRGPAGYRFMSKALQHAVPDVKLERGVLSDAGTGAAAGGQVWLSGHFRGTGEPINTVVAIDLKLAAAGWVEVAEARVDAGSLDKLREARLRS